ncbi:tetraprenyl-beta-curcumene synthase family protein [Virgibacillus ainsalahensis]
MTSSIPTSAFTLMLTVYRKVFPEVEKELSYWKSRAEQIPNEELRSQALASIEAKRFHCQGGGVYALLAGDKWREAIQFITAYQTISDYLDNLCDRSTSMDPKDFKLLHQAMRDALTPDNNLKNYYELREDQNDGRYLTELVQTCHKTIRNLDCYNVLKAYLRNLEGLYSDLQIHKHVTVDQRIPRLTMWHEQHKEQAPNLSWYEFSAACGSTLGIYCLVSYALGGKMTEKLAEKFYKGYFPFMQGLHILLDYYIDQYEDLEETDLNFCNYYADQKELKERFIYFIEQTKKCVQALPDQRFHQMVQMGLVGLYLGDPKVKELAGATDMKKALLKASGPTSIFFHWNSKTYYKLIEIRKQKA